MRLASDYTADRFSSLDAHRVLPILDALPPLSRLGLFALEFRQSTSFDFQY
jgi:hypothetical protein